MCKTTFKRFKKLLHNYHLTLINSFESQSHLNSSVVTRLCYYYWIWLNLFMIESSAVQLTPGSRAKWSVGFFLGNFTRRWFTFSAKWSSKRWLPAETTMIEEGKFTWVSEYAAALMMMMVVTYRWDIDVSSLTNIYHANSWISKIGS